ncbi:hypothetical protein chiPu_0019357 [Chiloscyllium punctatum]|uniref:IF rod domain-containing protein n=1 Tax=Chiloscyllium punctatum TaxID=137246 RepID=A0A401RRM8_CHIPU|nr:hypothetical protein [Chiloscyllium punctatum]
MEETGQRERRDREREREREDVRKLEQENQVLETRWDLLKHADTYKSNADKIVNMFCNKLKQQLSDLEKEREHLKLQISQTQQMVEDFKGKYEDEINSRTAMENEFVVLKKEVDDAYFQKVELESKLEYLTNLIEFLKLLYAEEIQELQSQVQSTAVTLKVNNKRQLDMKQIIDDIKLQHAEVAARNKQEANTWYQNKRASLESNIRDTDERGQIAINEAKQHIQQLQDALRKVKTDMAEQMREHQELLNANLALDMEIATYKKLLDGEEERDGVPASGTITRVVSSSVNPKGSFVRKSSKFMT